MNIQTTGAFLLGKLSNTLLSEPHRSKLQSMANEETMDELLFILRQAQKIAEPVVLFGVCPVSQASEDLCCINGICIYSNLVAQQLKANQVCFPFIATVGTALENWSLQFSNDALMAFYADEIKKLYLSQLAGEFFSYIKEQYRLAGHLSTLNPGSLDQWPISGQRELFRILGGEAFVKSQIGVSYTDSFLMLPTKTLSGIGFTSKKPYENCMYCGRLDCPDRRAPLQSGG